MKCYLLWWMEEVASQSNSKHGKQCNLRYALTSLDPYESWYQCIDGKKNHDDSNFKKFKSLVEINVNYHVPSIFFNAFLSALWASILFRIPNSIFFHQWPLLVFFLAKKLKWKLVNLHLCIGLFVFYLKQFYCLFLICHLY